MVLNGERQIVLANDKLHALLGRTGGELVGLRFGEAVDCIHRDDDPAGCGTTRFCRLCGAAKAMARCAAQGLKQVEECNLSRREAEGVAALDLRVWATPMLIAGEPFTVFAVRDVTDEKRRQVLERIFFHDLVNAAGGLRGILEIWPELGDGDDLKTLAVDVVDQIVEEIESQRDLAAAERGDLELRPRPVDARPILERLCALYGHHAVATGRRLAPPRISGDTRIVTDDAILHRVLGNLVKNALEASLADQAVTVSYHRETTPTFTVHNETVMPEAVQLQMFQRSFSTKQGSGRGVGSYSVRLLTERYLGGQVSFVSLPGAGTTFTIQLPTSVATSTDSG
ncbi:MAG: histidine kinase [Deltaproteobacteria bacterium]|nr:histidine kinase [Deltaproteobacteria bacterium]